MGKDIEPRKAPDDDSALADEHFEAAVQAGRVDQFTDERPWEGEPVGKQFLLEVSLEYDCPTWEAAGRMAEIISGTLTGMDDVSSVEVSIKEMRY